MRKVACLYWRAAALLPDNSVTIQGVVENKSFEGPVYMQ